MKLSTLRRLLYDVSFSDEVSGRVKTAKDIVRAILGSPELLSDYIQSLKIEVYVINHYTDGDDYDATELISLSSAIGDLEAHSLEVKDVH